MLYNMPPFGDLKTCLSLLSSVPEFIFIPYDVDENHINMFTDVKPAGKFCL